MRVLLTLCLLSVILVGCSPPTTVTDRSSGERVDVTENNGRFIIKHIETNVDYEESYILIDSKTGCEYLAYSESKFINGITPLLDSFGKPTGCFNLSKE